MKKRFILRYFYEAFRTPAPGQQKHPHHRILPGACVREDRAIKAEYLARKRAKAAPEAPTLKEAIDAYIKAHSNTLSPLTIRGYRTRRKAQNKNATSTRNVPVMIPELATAIQRDRKPAGPVLDITQNSLRCSIKKICREHDLPDVGVHGLRHSFASLAYHLQVPERIAMEIGGWADATTMHKIYTHIARSDVQRYQTAMTAFYAGKAPEKPQSENH